MKEILVNLAIRAMQTELLTLHYTVVQEMEVVTVPEEAVEKEMEPVLAMEFHLVSMEEFRII